MSDDLGLLATKVLLHVGYLTVLRSWLFHLPTDRHCQVGFSYDANGNLVSDSTTTFTNDVTRQQCVHYRLSASAMNDGWGTLIRETRDGLTTDLVLDEQATLPRVLAAIRSDGSEERYAYGSEGLHAQRTITGTTDMV